LLLEGCFLVVLLALTLAGAAVGERVEVWGVGLWSVTLFGLYLLALYILKQYEHHETWRPLEAPRVETRRPDTRRTDENLSTGQLKLRFAIAGLLIFAAGVVVALAGEALAEQTGLGASFMGATLVALSTSLPELSTTITAVRLGNHSMAVSNIFGSHALMVALLFLADLLYRPGPILAELGRPGTFAAAMGIVVTVTYLIGLIERKDRVVLRMGLDSAVVLVLYAVTVVGLYLLR
jgi:cation:H+ antiporter